jgi:iron complex outermembrane recepter protein
MSRTREAGIAPVSDGHPPFGITFAPELRAPWFRAAIAAVAVGLTGAAVAQDESLEEIVVTGTRIARPDFVSASPIITVPAEVLAQTGSSTVESGLNLMPQFVPGATGTTNNVADGQATLDLRGLGPGRTLVLLDGRRLIPANGEGVPDVNVIPPALIESVEIVTGGASAAYGSDAIAGVVNFKLRQSFDGVEFGGRWGQTSRGDGDEYDLSITAGMPLFGGRGSVMGFVGYSDRGQVNQDARRFSDVTLYYIGPGEGLRGPDTAYVPGGSGVIPEGIAYRIRSSDQAFANLFSSYGYPPGSVPWQPRFGFNEDGTVFTLGDFSPGSVANFRGTPDPLTFNDYSYFYNFASTAALQMPLERLSGFLAARYDFGSAAEVYLQALLADYTVNAQVAPTPLQEVYMPVSNPYVPADLALLLASRPNPDDPFTFGKRMTMLGPRVQQNQYDTYQVTAGFRGKVFDDWNYDTYVQFGESDQTKHQTGNVMRSRAMELAFAPDGGASICGEFNPFGLDAISQACADYVVSDAGNRARFQETIVEANMNGPVMALPAGELRAAVGLMYRDQSYRFRVDEILQRVLDDGLPDVFGLGAFGNIDADDHNFDAYVEARAPLLAGRTGVELLEAAAGYRYSNYASAGGVTSWKAELLYEPIETTRLRGSYQRAVRAPSIFELYQPRLQGDAYFDEGEPCSVGSPERTSTYQAQVEAVCVAQGLPPDLLPTYFIYEAFPLDGGNPDLEPERATTYTAGIVLQPTFESVLFDDVQLTFDWYQIELDNAVEYIGATEAIKNCYDPRYNPDFSPGNFWCSTFGRDPSTGEIIGAQSTYWNLASVSTSGIDTQLQWSFPAGPGRLSISWFVSWIASYQVQLVPRGPTDEFAGTVGGLGGSWPDWKWNLHLRYSVGGASFGARWRYVDSMADGGRYPPGIDVPRYDVVVPHYDYFDLEASYEFRVGALDGLLLRAGVENLTDRDPPIFPSWSVANTDASQYDVLGRRFFLSAEYRY